MSQAKCAPRPGGKRRLTPIERAAAGDDGGAFVPFVKKRGCGVRASAARAPSPYWAEQVLAGRGSFPPAADTTPMVECSSRERRCGRIYPFYYGVGCECEDCVNNRRLALEQRRRREGLLASQRADDIPDPKPPTAGDADVSMSDTSIQEADGDVDYYAHEEPRPVRISCELADRGVRLRNNLSEEHKILTEDEGVLAEQIGRYLAGQPTSLIDVGFSSPPPSP